MRIQRGSDQGLRVSELATERRAAPVLALAGVTYAYPNADPPALSDISLNLSPGEFTLLAGRSASGKSTLLRAACGLVPHFHGGEIEGRGTGGGPGRDRARAGGVAAGGGR